MNFSDRLMTAAASIFLVASSAPAFDTVVGQSPEKYERPTLEALNGQIEQMRNSKNPAQTILQLSAGIHGARTISAQKPSLSVPVRTPKSHSAGTTAKQNDSAASGVTAVLPENSVVFRRLFYPNIAITIKDEGYGLTPADWGHIFSLLNNLPVDHLAGIKEIIYGPGNTSGIFNEGNGILRIAASPLQEYPELSAYYVPSNVAEAVGLYVYRHVLTARDRAEFEPLARATLNNAFAPDILFALDYAGYLADADMGIEQSAQEAGPNPREGQRTNDPTFVLNDLFSAAIFIDKGQAGLYKFDNQGYTIRSEVPGSILEVGVGGQRWLSIGRHHFAMEGDKIVGYTTEDVLQPTSGPLHINSFLIWSTPVTVPQAILSRFPTFKLSSPN